MRQDAQRNRDRILAAAEQVFGEQGAAGSTEDVASRAGVGIGTVFRHFPTKNALIEAALIRHFARLTERARRLADAASPGEALRALVREMIETGPTKITLISLAAADDGVPAGADAASRELRDATEVVLRRAQDAGQARPEATIDEVYLLIRSLAQTSAATPVAPSTLRRAADIVLAGLANGVALRWSARCLRHCFRR
jgi:AcrR family transcriptional regulator